MTLLSNIAIFLVKLLVLHLMEMVLFNKMLCFFYYNLNALYIHVMGVKGGGSPNALPIAAIL